MTTDAPAETPNRPTFTQAQVHVALETISRIERHRDPTLYDDARGIVAAVFKQPGWGGVVEDGNAMVKQAAAIIEILQNALSDITGLNDLEEVRRVASHALERASAVASKS